MLIFSIKFFLTCLVLTTVNVIVSEIVWKAKTDKMPQWWLVIFTTTAIATFASFFITILLIIWTL